MIRTIALAAMMGGLMAVPVATPVQAASVGANCLILPLLQADCRAAINEVVSARHSAALDARQGPRLAWWWALNCHRAEAGAGHLYDCD
jgi:hypothetical protein